MKATLYKISCLTNLHVGNEGSSYSVIDKEVERDFDETPIIHSSGLKGALRSMMEENGVAPEQLDLVFGKAAKSGEGNNKGKCAFMDARMLYRPMRVCGFTSRSSIPVTSIPMLQTFIEMTTNFGCCPVQDLTKEQWSQLEQSFGDNKFLVMGAPQSCRVEDEHTGMLPEYCKGLLTALVGRNCAIAKSMEDYRLPVIARNRLENGTSQTLWYEEYVPRSSCFFTIMLMTEEAEKAELWNTLNQPVQIGGNASIGYGFTKLDKWESAQ